MRKWVRERTESEESLDGFGEHSESNVDGNETPISDIQDKRLLIPEALRPSCIDTAVSRASNGNFGAQMSMLTSVASAVDGRVFPSSAFANNFNQLDSSITSCDEGDATRKCQIRKSKTCQSTDNDSFLKQNRAVVFSADAQVSHEAEVRLFSVVVLCF